MAYDPAANGDDDAVLTARQAELRAVVEDIADHVMSWLLPQSYLEDERAVRAVAVSDRFLQAVPAEDKSEPVPSQPPQEPAPPSDCSPEGS